MTGESPEVQMARLEERMKTVLNRLDEAKEDQKNHREWMIGMSKTLTDVANRLQGVENNFARASPTIEEFITIKHKVVGAGVLGKWAWAAGAAIITFVYSVRESIILWITKQ
jgi:hypothetical protein